MWGLGSGLATVAILFGLKQLAPSVYTAVNPAELQIGVLAGLVNVVVLVSLSLLGRPMTAQHLSNYELS
jgi:hypothetical protein